jgi:cytochrome bd-type quinol oxidase subunit 2
MSFSHLHHFPAMLIFAALISIAVGSIARRSTKRGIQYAVWTFVMFILVSVAVAWLMYPFSR